MHIIFSMMRYMKRFWAIALLMIFQLGQIQSAWAYLLPVSGYPDGASLYIDTDTIVRTPPTVNLSYVISFEKPQSYGSATYLSKATAVKIDCTSKLIFALTTTYYSEANLQGKILGKYPLNDTSGNLPVEGSWGGNLVQLGCLPRRY